MMKKDMQLYVKHIEMEHLRANIKRTYMRNT